MTLPPPLARVENIPAEFWQRDIVVYHLLPTSGPHLRQHRHAVAAVAVATIVITVVVLLLLLLLLPTGVVRSDKYSEYLRRSMKGPLPPTDAELISYIKNVLLVAPSTQPYQLEGKYHPSLNSIHPSERFYDRITRTLFSNTNGGVFVEAGALDGEAMSNTLRLEKRQGWSGLLVEPDRASFAALQLKNRRSWTSNVCLSPQPFPSKELLVIASQVASSASNWVHVIGIKTRAMATLRRYSRSKSLYDVSFKSVQCVPLMSLLLALNMRHVDLLVLDVEGAEMDILKDLDFSFINIQVIFVEWKNPATHGRNVWRLELYGYRLLDHLQEDFVFVKKNSKYDPGYSAKL